MDSALVLLTAINTILALGLFVYRPFNAVSIVSVLTLLFTLIPAWLFYTGSSWELFYAWRGYAATPVLNAHGAEIQFALGLLLLILFAWQLGHVLALQYKPAAASDTEFEHRKMVQHALSTHQLSYLCAMAVLGGIWALSFLYFWQKSGVGLGDFLLPVKLTGAHRAEGASGYLKTIYMFTPLIMMALSILRRGGHSAISVLCLSLALIAAFSSHQRRELVTALMFTAGLHVYVAGYAKALQLNAADFLTYQLNRLYKLRVFSMFMFSFSAFLVPLLWYARVYFTSLIERGESINPFAVRSIGEIFLGSPSTGFPSFLLVQDYVNAYGLQPLHYVLSLFTLPIPRRLWQEKPETVDNILQNHYTLFENPSIFWAAEFYFNVGVFAVLLAFVVGFLVSRLNEKALTTTALWPRLLAVLTFMQAITFFKNGPLIASILGAVVLVLLVAGYAPMRFLKIAK